MKPSVVWLIFVATMTLILAVSTVFGLAILHPDPPPPPNACAESTVLFEGHTWVTHCDSGQRVEILYPTPTTVLVVCRCHGRDQ